MIDAPLIRVDINPLPDDLRAVYLDAPDGARLRVAFLPAAGRSVGTVVVVPGWAECIEKYAEVAAELRDRGLNVAICDPRGQGLSQKPVRGDSRGLVRDYAQLRDDLDVILAACRTRFGAVDAILAHSMGSLIVLDWIRAREGYDEIKALALSAPLARLVRNPVLRGIGRSIAGLLTALGLGAATLPGRAEQAFSFEGNRLTHDRLRHERFRSLLEAMPEAQSGPPRFAWINATMAATSRILHSDALACLGIPTLLVSATEEYVVDGKAHGVLDRNCSAVTLIEVRDAYHEILMETDDRRCVFWQAFDEHVMSALVLPNAAADTKARI